MTQDEKHVVRQILREKGMAVDSASMESLYAKHSLLFRRTAAGDCAAMGSIRSYEGLKEFHGEGA
jgi:hypothetical protein